MNEKISQSINKLLGLIFLPLCVLVLTSNAYAGGGKLPQLAAVKTCPASAKPGEEITCDVKVSNTTKEEYWEVTVVDVVPPELTLINQGLPKECKVKNGRPNCQFRSLKKHSSLTVSFKFRVGDKVACDSKITNTVDVGAKKAPTNWAKADIHVKCDEKPKDHHPKKHVPSKKLSIIKTGPDTISPGEHISYTVTIQNHTNRELDDTFIVDVFPSNQLTFVSASEKDCKLKNNNNVVCDDKDLDPYKTRQVVFTFKVKENVACNSQITNQADVHSDDAPSDWAKFVTQVICPVPEKPKKLGITKTGPDTIQPGEVITYTITVTNDTHHTIRGAYVVDPFPKGLTYLPSESTTGCNLSGSNVRCATYDHPPHETKVFTLSFKVPEKTACNSKLINQADIHSKDAPSDWAKFTTQVICPVPEKPKKLGISKTGPATIEPGQEIKYTITVTNDTHHTIRGAYVVDPFPKGLTYLPSESTAGCNLSGSNVRCATYDHPPHETKVFTLSFKVPEKTACDSKLVNQADIHSKDAPSDWVKFTTKVVCPKPKVSPVLPLLECVYDLGDHKYRAYFGYENTGKEVVHIQAGTHTAHEVNIFIPGQEDRGQVSTFEVGRKVAVFTVDFDGSEITWKVQPKDGELKTISASKTSKACKPVKPIAECSDKKPGNKFLTLFGYQNDNPFEIILNVPQENHFVPTPADRGQPNAFFSGRVVNAFSVNSGADLIWKLAKEQTKPIKDLPRCTPDEPPICDAGGPYHSSCQGKQALFTLDGSKSVDPDGLPLTYQWSTSCSGATLSDANAAKPELLIDTSNGLGVWCEVTLTVSDGVESSTCKQEVEVGECDKDCAGVPGGDAQLDLCGVCNGDNACLDCAGVPFGGAVIDQCGVCGGNDACVDCAGVPNGTAVIDECGVCGGDGTSCLECTEQDISNLQFALDIGVNNQRLLINRIAKRLERMAKAKNNDKRMATEAKKQAQELYQQAWTTVWTNLPRIIVNCANAQICTETDLSVTISTYNTSSTQLRDIALNLLRRIKNIREKNDKAGRQGDNKLTQQANQLHEQNLGISSQVPRFTSSC